MIDNQPRWMFCLIEKKYRRDNFDCGYPDLNEYLKKYARQNHHTESDAAALSNSRND